MKLGSLIILALSSAWLTACGSGGEYYDKSPSSVVSALRIASLPGHVMGGTIAGKRVTQPDGDTVVIAALDAGQNELVRFVATVRAEGEGSRVSVSVHPPEGRHKKGFEGAGETHRIAKAMLEPLAREHVDAAIEGRAFDMTFMNPAAKIMPGMSDQINQANEAAMEFSKMEQEAEFHSEYGNDWGSGADGSSEGWAE